MELPLYLATGMLENFDSINFLMYGLE